jgi:2,3-bisphosphoglycerate-independent phosphoglycerate mutase
MGSESAKYALILPDGAADEPVPELDGRTPLEAAKTPNLDSISMMGRQGTVVTVPDGFSPGSDVATLSVVGYDPRKYHTGRAPIEAAARKIHVGPGDVIYRCNLVTLVDGRMADFAAGHIRQTEAERLIGDLNARLGGEHVQFHCGVSYRHLMVLRGAGGASPHSTPPHDIPGEPVRHYLPTGRGSRVVRRIMQDAASILASHEVNYVRRELGENPANAIWLWGSGRPPRLPWFRERFGIRGAAIAAVDIIRGIAVCVGWTLIDVPGATGFLDTDYDAKGRAAVGALDAYDLVVVHIEAPDEAGHLGDAAAKVTALERIDEAIVGPVLDRLKAHGRWRILVAPDHPTPVGTRIHSATPPPFCMAGTGVESWLGLPFSEANSAESDLHVSPGHNLMEYFLRIT